MPVVKNHFCSNVLVQILLQLPRVFNSTAMKILAIFLTALLFSTGLSAQESNPKQESGRLSRQERKEIRDAKTAKEFSETSELLNSMHFVLEADYLSNQYGYRVMANSNLNFILVDSTEAVIQTGSNTGIGYNGVGGVTARGNISSWKVQRNEKKKSILVQMDVSTSLGYFMISMDIDANGKTTATLSSNRAGKLIYIGNLIPLEESYAFRGSSF